MEEKFSWSDLETDDEVQRAQLRVAVYLNPAREIVIRQEAQYAIDNEDTVVVLGRDAAMRLAARIRLLLSESE